MTKREKVNAEYLPRRHSVNTIIVKWKKTHFDYDTHSWNGTTIIIIKLKAKLHVKCLLCDTLCAVNPSTLLFYCKTYILCPYVMAWPLSHHIIAMLAFPPFYNNNNSNIVTRQKQNNNYKFLCTYSLSIYVLEKKWIL